MASVTVAIDCKAILGESPVCVSSGKIYCTDINGKKIHYLDSVNGTTSFISTPQMVGAVVPRAKGGLVACLEAPIVAVDLESNAVGEQLSAMSDEHAGPSFRFNDAKCDPAGRLWAGSMNTNWRDPSAAPGRLYVLEAQPGSSPKLSEKVFPTRLANGMAWSSDRTSMYFIDSFYRTVDRFDYSLETGEISNRRTAVQVSDTEPGPPDGMAIDAADKLWVVVAETGTVRQYDPETGKEIFRFQLPVQRPTSCAFGGKDLSELYVTTREEKNNPSPHAGALLRCHIPGAKGASFADEFAG